MNINQIWNISKIKHYTKKTPDTYFEKWFQIYRIRCENWRLYKGDKFDKMKFKQLSENQFKNVLGLFFAITEDVFCGFDYDIPKNLNNKVEWESRQESLDYFTSYALVGNFTGRKQHTSVIFDAVDTISAYT